MCLPLAFIYVACRLTFPTDGDCSHFSKGRILLSNAIKSVDFLGITNWIYYYKHWPSTEWDAFQTNLHWKCLVCVDIYVKQIKRVKRTKSVWENTMTRTKTAFDYEIPLDSILHIEFIPRAKCSHSKWTRNRQTHTKVVIHNKQQID